MLLDLRIILELIWHIKYCLKIHHEFTWFSTIHLEDIESFTAYHGISIDLHTPHAQGFTTPDKVQKVAYDNRY